MKVHETTQLCKEAQKSTRSFVRCIVYGAIVVMVAQSVGCSTMGTGGVFNAPVSAYRNHVWAHRAFNLRYGDCNREYSRDFERGFIDGYCAVCDGEDGYVPAVPPENYWEYSYQTPKGAKCVNAWFQGYPVGARAAKKDGAGAYHDLYVSKMINSAITQNKAKHVLPDDVPVVAPEQPTETTTESIEDKSMNDPTINSTNVPIIQKTGWNNIFSRN